MMTTVMPLRECIKCKEKKSTEEFYRKAGGVGYRNKCKECCINEALERYHGLKAGTRQPRPKKPDTGVMKICKMCGVEKDTSNFHVNRSSKDGLHANCSTCRNLVYRRRWQQR
jgi:hypothetical protein